MSQPHDALRDDGETRRQRLREWVIDGGRIRREDLRDDTPLLERRVITSLQVMDLILLIEELTGRPVVMERLKPGLFRDIDAICRNFLER